MIDKDTITHRHWSLRVGRADPETRVAPETYGEIEVSLGDLSQAIANLVLTPKGSVPTEPEKGVDTLGAIDKHPDIGIPYLSREIWDAIRIWEKRVIVEKVTVSELSFAHFKTTILWRPAEGVVSELQVTEVTFNG
ncbi:baseplate [Shinella sp.]|jgi:phage baseplate assembly protein W|uniref:baseplate n=1 Tax=Shinella sp. TaxID=1870904 RepID=UPI003F70534A